MTDCYQETLDYLYSFADYETRPNARAAANFDLRRMEALLARLDNPHLAMKTVHIAGTKGKGSTAAMVSSVLTVAGFKTGLYTSPHLTDVRERICVDGCLISQEDFIRLMNILKPEVVAVNAEAHYGTLTTFELLTALGFMYFAENKVDWQVVEVGLGGRLDATNVVCPDVCVISTISLDHTDVLGDTLTQIAIEKAGIIKDGVPVLSAAQPVAVRTVIADTCQKKDCRLLEVGDDIVYREVEVATGGQRCEVQGRLGSYTIDLPLLGAFQQANAALATGVLEVLQEKGHGLSREDIITGLYRVRWPGRFQIVRNHPLITVDGAHNPAAAIELKTAVETYAADMVPKILVVGVSADKDYRGFVEVLGPLFDVIVATHANHPRALNEMALAELCQNYAGNVRTASSVADAMNMALELTGVDGFICASGSLFVVGEALKWADCSGR